MRCCYDLPSLGLQQCSHFDHRVRMPMALGYFYQGDGMWPDVAAVCTEGLFLEDVLYRQ